MDARTRTLTFFHQVEDGYQTVHHSDPFVNKFTPSNIAGLMLLAVFIISPEKIGALFLFSYILGRLTNNKVPSLYHSISNRYENLLMDSGELEEEKFKQCDLIRPLNPLVSLPGFILKFAPFPGDLGALINLDASIINLVDKKMDSLFRRYSTNDLAKFNYTGECHGLMKIWYASLVLGIEKEFFKDLKAIASAAQSLRSVEFTPEQKNLIDVISEAQKKNIYAESNFIYLMGEGTKSGVEILEGECIAYSVKASPNFDKNLYAVAYQVIQRSYENRGHLIQLGLNSPKDGHAIGIVFYPFNGEHYYAYFDSNHKRARINFVKEELGVRSLTNLLKYQYRSYFEEVKDNFKNVDLTTYNLGRLHFENEKVREKFKIFQGLFHDDSRRLISDVNEEAMGIEFSR